ncbi:hypothetical protein EYF80_011264 [Liparis tanakae]|uniref:Uncharacterized protein n=1 Tax=Liparis tanakae TaxID=230148 RepID=A0A4Z2IL16_9TELE|nr:hypothetical protein EYF80_011264 [Liparis tanakae]
MKLKSGKEGMCLPRELLRFLGRQWELNRASLRLKAGHLHVKDDSDDVYKCSLAARRSARRTMRAVRIAAPAASLSVANERPFHPRCDGALLVHPGDTGCQHTLESRDAAAWALNWRRRPGKDKEERERRGKREEERGKDRPLLGCESVCFSFFAGIFCFEFGIRKRRR